MDFATVDAADPGTANRQLATTQHHRPRLVAVAVGGPLLLPVAALRPGNLGHLRRHQITHHLQADGD